MDRRRWVRRRRYAGVRERAEAVSRDPEERAWREARAEGRGSGEVGERWERS